MKRKWGASKGKKNNIPIFYNWQKAALKSALFFLVFISTPQPNETLEMLRFATTNTPYL